MNNSIIAWKTRAQLDDFIVKMFHGFSKPKNKFITRMNERDLWSWKTAKSNTWLAGQCIMYHKAVIGFDSHGRESHCKIDFGVMPVKLPWRDEELRLVVVKGFGQKPMMLLTNLAVNEKLQ